MNHILSLIRNKNKPYSCSTMFASQSAKNSSKLINNVPKPKSSPVSNGVPKRIYTARKSIARLDKIPQKPTNDILKKNSKVDKSSNLFQQISCTGAMPDVQVPVVRPTVVRRPFGANKPVVASRQSITVSKTKPGLKLAPVHSGRTLKSPRAAGNVSSAKLVTGPKVITKSSPRATTAILKPCKCPACVKNRASGAMDNLLAEGHVPQVSPKQKDRAIMSGKALEKMSQPAAQQTQEGKKITKQKFADNENFDNVKTWHGADSDKKSNGPTSFLKVLFPKTTEKVRDQVEDKKVEIQCNNLHKSDEDFFKNTEGENPCFATSLDSISVKWHAESGQQASMYDLDRRGSFGTRCDSFQFIEMQNHSINKNDTDNVPFIVLNSAKSFDVIRSKLGSRNGQRPQAVIEWKKGDILGRGAFGTVWSGLTITGELIAVKQAEISSIDIEKANKEYEKVQQEVELLKSLHHNNIVGYLGTCLDGRVVSIFMQYIPGGSLASILKKFGPLAEPVVSRYTKQILEGVGYLHSKNVIHRDLKGSNIMLVPNGVIKLIDFGCAKKLMNITKSNAEILKSMKGTPYWMAPEVVNETGHGKKSDVWSIGCTVYEMAVAKPPWSDLNKFAALFAISNGTASVPKLPDKFTQEAKDFVSLCLKREAKERPTVEKILQHKFILDYWLPESRIQDSRGIAVNSNKKI